MSRQRQRLRPPGGGIECTRRSAGSAHPVALHGAGRGVCRVESGRCTGAEGPRLQAGVTRDPYQIQDARV